MAKPVFVISNAQPDPQVCVDGLLLSENGHLNEALLSNSEFFEKFSSKIERAQPVVHALMHRFIGYHKGVFGSAPAFAKKQAIVSDLKNLNLNQDEKATRVREAALRVMKLWTEHYDADIKVDDKKTLLREIDRQIQADKNDLAPPAPPPPPPRPSAVTPEPDGMKQTKQTIRRAIPLATGLIVGGLTSMGMNSFGVYSTGVHYRTNEGTAQHVPGFYVERAPAAPFEIGLGGLAAGFLAFAVARKVLGNRTSEINPKVEVSQKPRSGLVALAAAATTVGAMYVTRTYSDNLWAIPEIVGTSALVANSMARIAASDYSARRIGLTALGFGALFCAWHWAAGMANDAGAVPPGDRFVFMPQRMTGAEPRYMGVQPPDPARPPNVRFDKDFVGPAVYHGDDMYLRDTLAQTADGVKAGYLLNRQWVATHVRHDGDEVCIIDHQQPPDRGPSSNSNVTIATLDATARGQTRGEPHRYFAKWGVFEAAPRHAGDACEGINLTPSQVPVVPPPVRRTIVRVPSGG